MIIKNIEGADTMWVHWFATAVDSQLVGCGFGRIVSVTQPLALSEACAQAVLEIVAEGYKYWKDTENPRVWHIVWPEDVV